MNTTTTTTDTATGFVVTVRADGWSCTCGQGARPNRRGVIGVDSRLHAALHDAEGDVLHVMGTRHPRFIDDLIAHLGDAVVSSSQWTDTNRRNSASRLMTYHHADIVIDPARMSHADAHAEARGRGFHAMFRRREVAS